MSQSAVSKAAFRDAVERAGLTQTSLALLLGKTVVTVNRWFVYENRPPSRLRPGAKRRAVARKDVQAVPRYAWAFVIAFSHLSSRARARTLADLSRWR